MKVLRSSPAFRGLPLFFVGALLSIPNIAAELIVEKGDRICLVGNELGERMQHHNYWETLLHRQFPQHELSVRNLCFPGDEVALRIRSENFGTPKDHLKHSKATVILYFFGFNESFSGEAGLENFAKQLREMIREARNTDYSGKGAPRLVLVSPIAFESTGNPHLPTGDEQNRHLAQYTETMQSIAEETQIGFVDLFTPTQQLFEQTPAQLTLNGAHLNEAGYKALAPIFMQALFGESPDATADDPSLQEAIADKNFHWWHRYRAVNGYSIYGTRGLAGSDGTYNNRDVMERERVILDQMTENRDQRIWQLVQGKNVAGPIDDDNTLPFINPKTNVGGSNDPNAKAGKLGTLEYLSSDEQLKRFKLPPGYKIELFASEEQFPELANPVALNFDSKGRLWVSTMQSYPHWKPKTELNDKVLIFEDQNEDGRADKCIVFAEGLHQPTGFELINDGAYVAMQPDILLLKDTDGDNRADERVRQLVGFDSADTHHGLAAFEWGPDGALYFQEGTFKFSQVESPHGLTRMHEAGIWRYEPLTGRMEAHVNFAFSNPWGHVFDRWGQNFIGDASPGFSYWAAPISGRIDFPLKHPGGSQHRRIAAETGGEPDYRFPTFYPKRIRPLAGCAILSSEHFPPEVQGNFLVTNCIGERVVLNHEIREAGSGFEGKEVEPIVSCEDGNFRPVDIDIAPDGSIYIVDWHNALIGHLQHNLREPNRDHSHGRIWRITYPARPLIAAPKIAGAKTFELLDELKSSNDRNRYRVRRELMGRDAEEVVPAVKNWLESLDASDAHFEHHQLEAMWVLQSHHLLDEALLQKLLASEDHRVRAAATRALSTWLDELTAPLDWLRPLVSDSHARVRLEAVRALSFLKGSEDSLDVIEVALTVLDGDVDDYLQYTLDETIRALEQ